MSRSPDEFQRSPAGWTILIAILAIESIAGAALLSFTVWQLLQSTSDPLGDRVSVFIAVLLSWIWVLVTLLAGARRRIGWARSSALTIHVLLFAAATGVLQFGVAPALWGWALIVVAIVGFIAALLAQPAPTPNENVNETPN